MATVDKNFRIKNGLAVEGTTATVNGNNILTENAGDSYIINLIGGSADTANTPNTVVKRDGSGNFAAGQITVTDINIGTIGHIWNDGDLIIANTDNQDVILQGEDIRLNAQDDVRLNAGTGGDVFIQATSGNINLQGPNVYVGENLNYVDSERVASQGYVDESIANIDLTFNTDEISEGTTNLYFTNQRAIDAGDGVFDGFGAAAAAQTAAQSYADGLASNYDSAGSATTAENNAKSYADSLINDGQTTSTNNWSAYKTSTEIGLAQAAAEGYTDTAVANLVDSAPALLNTLNELAAAIGDNPNYAVDLAASVGEKVAKAGDTMTGALTLSGAPTSDLHASTKKYVDDNTYLADMSARGYADGLISTEVTDRNDAITTAVSNLTDGNTEFTKVAIGWMSDEVASYVNAPDGNSVTAYSWNKYEGASAKFLVRVRNGIHSQISEVLLTRDNADNIAITEYGIVTTNGILADITAVVSGSNINLNVDPIHEDGTEIIVAGTLMNYGD